MKTKSKSQFKFFASFGIGKDKDYFIENLSMLVSAGMGILEALSAISIGVKTKKMKSIINTMSSGIEAGSPIWKALENSYIFPAHTVSLIRIGEKSGKLSQNLKVVGLQDEKDRVFNSKIRSAMMYPMFVLVLTLIVGIGIAWFILPKLSLVFSQLHLELPFITKYLIAFGVFLGEYGKIAVPIFLLALFSIIYFIFFFPKTKFIGQNALFSLPGIKRLIQEIELARFGYLLGTLLKAGLPIIQALDSLEKATTFPHYKMLYRHLLVNIDDGYSFKKSLMSYKKINKLIPMPIQLLIATGEKSGNLSNTLLSIGKRFEIKTETTTKDLTVILEPILLIIVWLGVVGVALAVILPIYNLIGGFGGGL